MIKKERTLSEVIEYFKKNQIPSFEEEIDEYGGYFITAARLAAVILAPNPLVALTNFCAGIDAASLRVSKLFSWLPDKFKYGNKGREKFAIQRYELSSIIYIKLLDIAILNGFNDIVAPVFKKLLENIEITETDKEELNKLSLEAENAHLKTPINTFAKIDKQFIIEIFNKTIEPLLPFLLNLEDKCIKDKEKKKTEVNKNQIEEQFTKKVYTLFNAFLINFSSEFPDFTLWCDIRNKQEILDELGHIRTLIVSEEKSEALLELHHKFENSVKVILERLESLNKNEFLKVEGFPSFDDTFNSLYKIQTDSIIDKLDEKTRNNITAHHNLIKSEVEKPLSDNDDIESIIYPKNQDIYIAQSYHSIIYKRKEHRKVFLTTSSYEGIAQKGEDVGKFLLTRLIDPNSAYKPIIILGNPGAGKSMFSKMFAAKLCSTNDFIPLLIRLRDVASSSANIAEHINKGIAKSIALSYDINWIEWAKLFKTRTPVIILDGFDELMQSSNTELNGYINTIKELQESALHHNICLRVILTSRIAIMQDVSIPDGTIIVKLNSFDDKRKELWIKKWNSFQTKKDYKFILPKNSKILELSQEPLLLFMLAVYDFPAAELQLIAQDKLFNQSKLYDSLLKDFGLRQLEKEENYRNANPELKKNEEELFRLRLGMIALLMFLNDTTNKDIQRLDEELKVCKLDHSKIKPVDVLTGFFFVHQNKATSENEIENYNYEFLHKSFGEFLTADFLLKIALKQKDRKSKDFELFQFCFGYNWLHKHPEIQRFLFEHAPQVFNLDQNEQERIIEDIQDALAGLFDKTINDFPISRFTIIEPKSKIEHIAIYSQNLVFLWSALTKVDKEIFFDVLSSTDNLHLQSINKEETFNYAAQDREESNQNKLLWKRISSLWQLVGNYHSVAKLNEWIEVKAEEKIILKRRKEKLEIRNNFSESSIVKCNDFDYVLSLFDTENKIGSLNFLFNKLEKIIKQKPELIQLICDALINRLWNGEDSEKIKDSFFFILNQNLNTKQIWDLTDKFMLVESNLPEYLKVEIGEKLFGISFNYGDFNSQLKLIKYLYKYRHHNIVKSIFDNREVIIEKVFLRSLDNARRESPSPFVYSSRLKLINELTEDFDLHRLLNPKMLDRFLYESSKDFKYLIRENPQIVLEYIKVIKSFGRSRELRKYLDPEVFEEIFKEMFERFMYSGIEDYYTILEFLKQINELSKDFQIRMFLNPNILEDIVYKFVINSNYVIRENPQLTLEYIKLIKNFSRSRELRKYLNPEIFEEIFERFFLEVKHTKTDNFYITFEYLKLINELKEVFQNKEFLNPKMLDEFLFELIKDINYIIREYPQVALEYIKLMKNFGRSRELHEYLNPGIFEEISERFYLEVKHSKANNLYTILEYLKLINELSEIFQNKDFLNSTMLKEIIHRFREDFKYLIHENSEIALEFLKLTTKLNLVEIIIADFPQLKKIYKANPADFIKYFSAFTNVFNNEDRN